MQLILILNLEHMHQIVNHHHSHAFTVMSLGLTGASHSYVMLLLESEDYINISMAE